MIPIIPDRNSFQVVRARPAPKRETCGRPQAAATGSSGRVATAAAAGSPDSALEEGSPLSRLLTESSPGQLAAAGLESLSYLTPETGRAMASLYQAGGQPEVSEVRGVVH